MKILLVGANGQVGREIQDLCEKNNITCIALGREQLDISNAQAIEEKLAAHISAATYLVNAAAYTAVDKAEDEIKSCYQVNCEAVANLAHFAKKHNVPLIHISTDYVFAGEKDSAYVETDIPAPKGVYGASKLEGEMTLQEILPQHIILRVSWVFGQYGKNFVKTILRLAGEQEKLRIVADQHGNPTGAAHIAEVILTIVQRLEGRCATQNNQPSWGTYHYCDAPSTTWFNFTQSIVEIGQRIKPLKVKEIQPITTLEFPTKAARPMNSQLNCDKITKVFGIKQFLWQTELEQVIKKVLE